MDDVHVDADAGIDVDADLDIGVDADGDGDVRHVGANASDGDLHKLTVLATPQPPLASAVAATWGG